MPFWNLGASHTHDGVFYTVLAALLVTAGLLWRMPRRDRLWALRTLALFFLSLGTLALANTFFDPANALVLGVVRALAVVLEGLSLIALTGRLVVDVILPPCGVRAPVIMRDLIIATTSGGFLLLRLHAEGVEITAIITTSAVVTVTLGIALQDTLGNLLGGLSLQLDDSINVGDWIRHDNLFGRVVSMGWRHTSFVTNSGEHVIIPNSMIVKGKFVVLGQREGGVRKWRRWINLTIDDSVPPPRVIETLERALTQSEIHCMATHPAPSAVLMELEQGVAKYGVRYWLTDFSKDDTTDSAVRTHLYFALRRADIALVSPKSVIEHAPRMPRSTTSIDAADRKMVVELLGDMDIFKPLHADEREALAQNIRLAPFAKGDVITRQGADAHWLYIVADGEVEVVWEGPNGTRHTVAEIGPRDFFGEMGLLTGEPRTATVIAKTDAVCWRLDKQAFLSVLQSRPELALALSQTLTRRRDQLDELRARVSHAARLPPRDESDILSKIRAFFDLR